MQKDEQKTTTTLKQVSQDSCSQLCLRVHLSMTTHALTLCASLDSSGCVAMLVQEISHANHWFHFSNCLWLKHDGCICDLAASVSEQMWPTVQMSEKENDNHKIMRMMFRRVKHSRNWNSLRTGIKNEWTGLLTMLLLGLLASYCSNSTASNVAKKNNESMLYSIGIPNGVNVRPFPLRTYSNSW